MSEYGGFVYYIDEPNRAEKLLEALNDYKDSFTDIVSSSDLKPKQTEIFLITFDGQAIEMAGLVRRGNKVATDKVRIRFTELLPFEPVELDRIESRLANRVKPYFSSAKSGTTVRLAPKTWLGVWQALMEERPSVAADLDHLENLRREMPVEKTGPSATTMAHEKDAAMLALKMAGIAPSEFISRTHPEEGLSLFEGIQAASLTEDQMIKHDASIFADWELVQRTRVGEAIFYSDSRVVTIMDVNRTSIEKTLGVDLLYYIRPWQTFLMVQYKRMIEEDGGGWGYRPDEQCKTEVRRMWSFLESHPDHFDETPRNYRLNSMPFYMKLCPKATFEPTSSKILKGMYLPLDLWEATCNSPEVRGPRDGIRLTYKNVPIWLNTSKFLPMVQDGLFGSRGTRTDELRRLVEEKVEMNHSVVIAEVDDEPTPRNSNAEAADPPVVGQGDNISF